ncbi:MarR family winged helix-turn-helix transcriptional regulator [Clostridium sp. UBA4548]|uniref:MarR family winged helix-turn-helix transcriptional regulator n=1 Tax=Clostridium sp. UBA4548 TaxID=1946361 RepID=UPI0025BF19B8|nr:MarR family transcriptional regulator [Clostridium sp. UBA4548]
MKELHKAIIKLSKTHRKLAFREFAKIDLTEGQPKILSFLAKNNGCIQKDIADNCRIKPATVTSVLANMEKAELIYRSQNSENRRILNVFLTDKGVKAQKQVGVIFNKIDDLCFKGFSEEEKLQAIELLDRIQSNLDGKEDDNA